MENIFNYKLEDLEEYFLSIGEKKFKARQVFEWIYKKHIYDFYEMSNISKVLQEKLNNTFSTNLLTIKTKQTSKLTNKYLFELDDGNYIEAVLMRHDYGNSICVSSQVGCNMGCTFCESGRLKKVRNLDAADMVRQIIMIQEDIDERIDSVVVMGIGEPFDNYTNVMNFVRIINSPYGIEIGARHITISTSGLIPMIKKYGEEDLQTNLAISLHAPNDELRTKLMPVNRAYPIKDLIKEISEYIDKTNRRVTIEYLLLKDINDTKECAIELSKLLRGLNVYVNLIPYNETSHIEYKTSPKENVMNFYDILKKNKINVTVRKRFGDEIDAACGQLRANEVDKL
jgi:23S rRNA (adenine2503-C2)-methyltransferase